MCPLFLFDLNFMEADDRKVSKHLENFLLDIIHICQAVLHSCTVMYICLTLDNVSWTINKLNDFWATGMSYLLMYGSAGDKRSNVLLVPGGYYVDVTMIVPFLYCLFVTDVWLCLGTRLQADKTGHFRKVGHYCFISSLER